MTQTKTPTILALSTWAGATLAGIHLAGWTVAESALAGLVAGVISLICYLLALLIAETRRPY